MGLVDVESARDCWTRAILKLHDAFRARQVRSLPLVNRPWKCSVGPQHLGLRFAKRRSSTEMPAQFSPGATFERLAQHVPRIHQFC